VYLVDELYKAVDVESAVADLLPADFERLAPVLASTIRQPATEAVDDLLATEEAQKIWRTVSREAHAAFIAVLEDDGSAALSTTDGAVTLDLGQLVERLAVRVGLSGDRLAELPEGTGVVTLLEAGELESAQDIARTIERTATLLTLLVLVVFGSALWFSPDRRRTLRNVGIGFVVVGVVVLAARSFGIDALAGLGSGPGDEPALSVLAIGTSLLRQSGLTQLTLGLLLISFAVLAGPTRAATRFREIVSPAMRYGVASAIGAGIVLALVVSWFRAPGPATSWLPVVIFLATCLGGAVWLQRITLRENPA
jgi:hypothetical protein